MAAGTGRNLAGVRIWESFFANLITTYGIPNVGPYSTRVISFDLQITRRGTAATRLNTTKVTKL